MGRSQIVNADILKVGRDGGSREDGGVPAPARDEHRARVQAGTEH